MVRASVRLARAGDQVRRAFGIRTRNPGREPELERYPCQLLSSRRANNERALLSHRLAHGQRTLANLMLLPGDVS